MAPPVLRPLSAGEILDTSFTLYRRHFGALATVALVCTGLPLLLRLFLDASGGLLATPLLSLLYAVTFGVLNLVATGATVFIVAESYLGRPISAREALSRAAPFMFRILVCSSMAVALAFIIPAVVIGGTLLLVSRNILAVGPALAIPVVVVACTVLLLSCIILAVGLALAIPALVLESGTSAGAALSRSWDLTRGSRWRIFGLGVTLLALLYVPLAAILGVTSQILPGATAGVFGRGSASVMATVWIEGLVQLVQMFVYPLFYCVLIVTYYDLRVRKEGFDLELLASSLQPA